ncbi:MAG: caspase family protein, partial [Cyclobacteriaceae bacterium]|nr:caspase family protein [Cyclobacteriaceae bacterium]
TGSWMIQPEFADLNEIGKTVSLEEEIVQQVEQRIRRWERKGEFEKSSEYLERVTTENRNAEIKVLTKQVINELGSRYIRFENMEMGLYNADAEMFTLYIPGMMSSLIPVPIQDASYFKNNWHRVEIRNPEFAVHDDQFVLAKFEAWLDGTLYDYDAYHDGIYISNFGGKPQLDNIRISLPELPLPLEYVLRVVPVGTESGVDLNIPLNEIRQDYIFGLVIGNEDYSSFQVGLESNVDVDYAENDARTFTEYLRKTLGIPDENITLLINATAGQIKQALAKMTALAKAYDGEAEFIFYYAGHGLPDEKTGEPYLMPVDVAPSDLAYAIPLQEVYEKFTNYQSGKVTLFLDACFSGGARNEAMMASRGIRIRPKSPFVMGNLIVFSASRGDQTAYAYADEGHGMFTYHLLKKMQETRGMASFGELADYLEKEVNRRSLLVNNREQEPMVKVSPILEYTWRDFSFIHQRQVFNE